MSRAGQADAVGGVFRGTVATYLAMHALREHAVAGLDLPPGVYATRLDFETQDPTDDIKVTFSDGRRAFISAKRAAGDSGPFHETVDGWGAQVATAGPDDLLVLAAEELRGVVRELDSALRRHRSGQPVTRTIEKAALAAVTKRLPPSLHAEALAQARVLHIPSATAGTQTQSLLAALAGYVVEDGNGAAALAVLSDEFNRRAGTAGSSKIEDWVRILKAAGHPVARTLSGPAGMRAAARVEAETAYRAACVAERGRIDLSLLAEDLPPIVVDDLIDGLQIKLESDDRDHGHDLLRYVRRWRRILLVGQPGAGKSVAMRELASHCAGLGFAPIPVRISLTRLLRNHPEPFTLDALLAAASEVVGPDHQQALLNFLRAAVERGDALLLCDGLDECGSRAPWVAQQLRDVLDGLPVEVGLVVATRASAVAAAGRLDLPRADLVTPTDLRSTVEAVLEACAQTRVPAAERETWIRSRREWIEEAQAQHGALLSVPLLAILLALICADTDDSDLPKGRALVLHGAVVQSIERWEKLRAGPDATRPWDPQLTSDMLLDGYVTLGRLLDSGATPSRAEAAGRIEARLRDLSEWGLAPARAREVAKEVLRFWDEHVAVFVFNAADELTSRSKVFAEIATAMWTRSCSDDELVVWLSDVVDFTDSDGAIALAAGLGDRTVAALIDLGSERAPATTLLASLVERGVISITEAQARTCLSQLATHLRTATTEGPLPERTSRRPPPGSKLSDLLTSLDPPGQSVWQLIEHACLLPLATEDRDARNQLIRSAGNSTDRVAIATAICALADAGRDGRPLTLSGVAAVQEVADRPLPPEAQTVQLSRRRSAITGGGDVTPGIPTVALMVCENLDQFAEDVPKWIYNVSQHARMGFGTRIKQGLTRAGVDTRPWEKNRWQASIAKWLNDHEEFEERLLTDMAALAASPTAVETHEDDRLNSTSRLWSLPDLGALLSVTKYHDVGIPEFARAFKHDSPELRVVWLDALCDAYAIDKAAVARQAHHLLHLEATTPDTTSPRKDGWWVAATTPPPNAPAPELHANALSARQQGALLDCLWADSDWIAYPAAEVLINIDQPTWDSRELFTRAMSDWPRHRSALVYAVAILSAGDSNEDLLRQAATSENADYRVAARNAVRVNPALDYDSRLVTLLAADLDLAVRGKQTSQEASDCLYWSCDDCRARNDLEVEDCPNCEAGVRPD